MPAHAAGQIRNRRSTVSSCLRVCHRGPPRRCRGGHSYEVSAVRQSRATVRMIVIAVVDMEREHYT
jgi:hypothetical protein